MSQGSPPALTIAPAQAVDEPRPPLAFVEVVTATDPTDSGEATRPTVAGALSAPTEPAWSEPGWSLWGDLDR
jgi:hypothetical protein